MKDGTYRRAMLAAAVAGPLATIACSYAASRVETGFLTVLLAFAAAVGGFAFGWASCYWWTRKNKETPHNRKCREMLAELERLPRGQRWGYIEKMIEHDKVDGRSDTANAIESLKEQGCIRDIEVRYYLDGNYNVYAGGNFGVTGKRYVND